jgi:hypothetical protein
VVQKRVFAENPFPGVEDILHDGRHGRLAVTAAYIDDLGRIAAGIVIRDSRRSVAEVDADYKARLVFFLMPE